MSQFQNLNYNNMCKVTYSDATSEAACETVGAGLLAKGLKIAEVSIVEFCRTVVTSFEATKMTAADKRTAYQSSPLTTACKQFLSAFLALILTICSTNLVNLLSYVSASLDSLVALYVSNFNDYLNYTITIENLKFGLFVAFVFVIFVYIWSKYLGNLSSKIWRTKGMLNMIPMDLISKNQNLKTKFINGDLLQAVK